MSARTRLLVATAIAAAAAATSGFAQTASVAVAPEQRLLEQIAEMRAEGPAAVGLIDALHDLARLYESAGKHAPAIVALEEARHITRIHQGLSSADEALLLREQVRNEKELGYDERAWALEQEMVTIARQHYDDIRMSGVFRELADDRSDALEQYRSGQMPPLIYIGCYYIRDSRPYHDKRGGVRPPNRDPTLGSDGAGCQSGQSSSVVMRLGAEILEYYADAIEVVLRSGDYTSPELRDLEKQMFRTRQENGVPGPARLMYSVSPAQAHCRNEGRQIPVWALDELLAVELLDTCLAPVIRVPLRDDGGVPVRANTATWTNLVRSIIYEIRSGAPPAARANAIAELADWILVNTPPARRRYEEGDERALDVYGRAYRELEQDDDARASLFAPDVPVTLPTYEPNPFASAAEAESSRYIDVAFAVTKQGEGERIEILETSRGATRTEQRELIRLIEESSFRPRFVDGALADSAPVLLRYYLGP